MNTYNKQKINDRIKQVFSYIIGRRGVIRVDLAVTIVGDDKKLETIRGSMIAKGCEHYFENPVPPTEPVKKRSLIRKLFTRKHD